VTLKNIPKLFIALGLMVVLTTGCALHDCQGHRKHRLANGVII